MVEPGVEVDTGAAPEPGVEVDTEAAEEPVVVVELVGERWPLVARKRHRTERCRRAEFRNERNIS